MKTDGKSHTAIAIIIVCFSFLVFFIVMMLIILAAVFVGLRTANSPQSQLTQVQADQFAQKIFTLINQKRTTDGFSPINENQNLCVYVNKILTEAQGEKNFAWSQHFLEDTANSQFQTAYFNGFTQEFYEYTPTLPVDQAIPAANDWYTKKGLALNDKTITDGCVRSDPTNTIFIYAKAVTTAAAPIAVTTSAAAVPSCTRLNIYTAPYTSDKCYDADTLSQLQHYLNDYSNAAQSGNGASADMQITCNGSSFFAAQCATDKQTLANAKATQATDGSIIQELIAKGIN